MNEAKSFFDYISIALRYIIAGFVCLVVLLYIDTSLYDKILLGNITNQHLLVTLFLAGLAGIMTYALHYAFLDKIFYWITLVAYSVTRKFPENLRTDVKNWNKLHYKWRNGWIASKNWSHQREYLFSLVSQTYLRKVSTDLKVRELQKEMETKLALLMFLYGCCYATIIFPLLYKWLSITNISADRVTTIRIIGFIILGLALRFDWRITLREIWICQNFYQNIDKTEDEQEFVFYLQGFSDKSNIYVSGTFGNWLMTKKKNYWILKTQLPIGEHTYEYKVDGVSTKDPNNSIEKDGKSLIVIK
jgi:hypothetical protein